MSCQVYNAWRRDIAAEYVLRTGRCYPKRGTHASFKLIDYLVRMSDREEAEIGPVPDPIAAVDELITVGLLKG